MEAPMAIDLLPNEKGITQTAEEFGISLRTLRFYESKGLIRPVRIGTSRVYTSDDRIRLKLIATGKRLGFSLAQIHDSIGRAAMESEPDKSERASGAGSLTELLSKDQIGQQLQIIERQRDELDQSIAELKEIAQRDNSTVLK